LFLIVNILNYNVLNRKINGTKWSGLFCTFCNSIILFFGNLTVVKYTITFYDNLIHFLCYIFRKNILAWCKNRREKTVVRIRHARWKKSSVNIIIWSFVHKIEKSFFGMFVNLNFRSYFSLIWTRSLNVWKRSFDQISLGYNKRFFKQKPEHKIKISSKKNARGNPINEI